MRHLKLALLIFTISAPAFAALGSGTVWEVRVNGSANNAGCFWPGVTSPGTDYSQRNTAEIAYTDMVLGSGGTSYTSMANPATSAIVGNCIHVVSGTGCTASVYQVTAVSAGVATLDRSAGTATDTCTANLGGALTPAGMATWITTSAIMQTIWWKADSTFSTSSQFNMTATNNLTEWTSWIGYSSTRGDGGMVTINSTNSGSAAVLANNVNVQNFIINGNGDATNCIQIGAHEFSQAINITAKNCTTSGIDLTSTGTSCTNCYATGISGATSYGVEIIGGAICIACVAYDNTDIGIYFAGGPSTCMYCLSSTNSYGFYVIQTGSNPPYLINSVAYDNTNDGLNFDSANSYPVLINNVFDTNGGYGINNTSATATLISSFTEQYNAFYNNTSGASLGIVTSATDFTLTADPFVSASTGNFALNATSGGGAALKGLGFPGALIYGGTGYTSPGALQPQASGGQHGSAVLQ